MITKTAEVKQIQGESIVYESTIKTEVIITFTETIGDIKQKLISESSKKRIQQALLESVNAELSLIELDSSISNQVKGSMYQQKYSSEKTIEEAAANEEMYLSILKQYNENSIL
jgi:hypothetical protein